MVPTLLAKSAGIFYFRGLIGGFLPPTRLYTQNCRILVGTVNQIPQPHSDLGPQADSAKPSVGQRTWPLPADSWVGGTGGAF